MDLENELTDDEDFLELVNILQEGPRRRRVFRIRQNHFLQWNEQQFLMRFRLSKQTFRFILSEIEPLIALPTLR